MDNIIWVGSPNHYSGRAGYKVTHITLHIMAGFLTGTDSVFLRSSSQASAHYGIGANGEIHQYVDEVNGSWSDADYNANMSTISIEHEGGIPQARCTQACIDASARLCADISQRHTRKRVVAPRNQRHRPHHVSRPSTKRTSISTGDRRSKQDNRRNNNNG